MELPELNRDTLSNPEISVLMPAYNSQTYVRQAIDSILAQTFSVFQLLVIDDGSTDATAQIVADLAQRDRRIRLVRQANQGIARALNEGLKLIASPLVARMDSDDIALPDRLQKQYDFLKSHPSVAAVGGQARIMQGDRLTDRYWRYPCDPASIHRTLPGKNVMIHPTVTFRRQAVSALGGYHVKLSPSEDYDLWLRLSEKHDLANLPDVLVHYRQHVSSSTSKQGETQSLASLAARWAAMQRSQGRADPLADPHVVISEESLLAWGVTQPCIDRTILDSLADAVAVALADGHLEMARQRLVELAAHPSARRMGAAMAAHRHWLAGRLDWAQGDRWRGIRQMIHAGWLKPKYLERLVRAAKNRRF